MTDYSLGLMVRKARCLHQKLKLECSGRAIRRMGPLAAGNGRPYRDHGCEATEQGEATPGGSRGGKGLTQGEQPLGGRGSDTEPKYRVDPNNGCASDDERH